MQNRIGILRRAKKMSQAELAAAAGTTRSQINRLEHGGRRLSLDWMTRIAHALDVNLSELLPNDGAASPASPEAEILRIVSLLPEKDKLMLVGLAREILRHGEVLESTEPVPAPDPVTTSQTRGRRG
jgi:transcriptional regulator with XRE-family HTH domain